MSGRFSERKSRLELPQRGGGVDYVLNEGYKVLGNPIAMFDTSYHLLTYVDGVATDDWLWNEIITHGTFSHETVDFFNREGFIAAYAQAQVVALMKSDKLKYDRINGKLFDKDGVQLGNIIVIACMKPFAEGDMELIELLSEALSVELQNSDYYQRIDRVYQKSMFNALLDGKIQNSEAVKAHVAQQRGQLKANLYLAVVDITQYEQTVTHLAYFRDLFKKFQPEYRYYIHLNNIVVIIHTDYSMLSIERDLGKLNGFFEKYKIYAGISSVFHDFLELPKYHREAICALNYGLSDMNSRQIFKYDNYRIEQFLNSVKHIADISEIYSPVIYSIQAYDRENNTSLLRLLYAYLLSGKDSALTCERMGITESRLDDRIRMLEESFEIDWKDGDMLCNLLISMKLHDNLLSEVK